MTVKSIKFKFKLVGEGIVNFDSSDQRFIWNKQKGIIKDTNDIKYDNVSFAKGTYKKTKEGFLEKTVKISSDCLRHNIHVESMEHHTANSSNDKVTLNKYTASTDCLLRGFALMDEGLFRKGYNITSAKNTTNSISTIDVHSKSGQKISTEDTAGNSFFYKESCGDMLYEGKGDIDLKNLQFISIDDIFGRRSVADDSSEFYRQCLEKTLGSKVEQPKHYVNNKSTIEIPERGIVLTNEQQVFLVREFFKRLASVYIGKSSGGYAQISEIQIKYVESPLNDRDSGYTTIFSNDKDFNEKDIDFKSEVFYTETNEEKALELKKTFVKTEKKVEKKEKKQKSE